MPLIPYSNILAAISQLLLQSGIRIQPELIKKELDKHPDSSTLLAISDVLASFHISSSAYKIGSKELLVQMQGPFIAHTKINDGDFVTVNKISGSDIFLSSDKWNNRRVTLSYFESIFTGYVLNIDDSIQSNKTVKHQTTWFRLVNFYRTYILTLIALLLLIVSLAFHSDFMYRLSWPILMLVLFKITGLITSVLLLVQSVDNNAVLVQKICKASKQTDCNAILTSKAAGVFEGLTWSEVGFFYFAGTALTLIFTGSSIFMLAILFLFNLVSLPYTVYSVYYQAKVAKQWCILCCTVQILLWLEAIALFLIPDLGFKTLFQQLFLSITLPNVANLFICMLLPVLAWKFAKPFFERSQQLAAYKEQLNQFKYNSKLFTSLLSNQPRYLTPDKEWSIVLGNENPEHIITMVSNLYCKPCSEVHDELHELLNKNENLQARIIFNVNPADNDHKSIVTTHIMALLQAGSGKAEQALNAWYAQKEKNYDTWAKHYPANPSDADPDQLRKQSHWCRLAGVIGTPTLFVDGCLLPEFYKLSDLTYMLG